MRKTLKKYFIPHEENNYHPHILHTKRAVLYSGLAVAMKVLVVISLLGIPSSVYVFPDILAVEQQEIIKATNELRKSLGVSPLKENTKLDYSAQLKTQDMARSGEFSHVSSDGRGLVYFLKQANYSFSVAGENLAMGYTQMHDLMSAWEKSPTHYQNLVDSDYLEVGVGMLGGTYNDISTIYVAQHFASPKKIAVAAVVEETKADATTDEVTTTPDVKEDILGEKLPDAPVSEPTTTPVEPEAKAENKPKATTVVVKETVAEDAVIEDTNVVTTTLYSIEKSTLTWQEVNGQTEVKASVTIVGPIARAVVFVQNNVMPLIYTADNVYQGSIVINEQPRDFFKAIFPATLEIITPDGEVLVQSLQWESIPVFAPNPIEKYKSAKHILGPYLGFFQFSRFIYLGLLIFFSIALFLNIVIEWRHQHHHVIVKTVALLGLITLFYFV